MRGVDTMNARQTLTFLGLLAALTLARCAHATGAPHLESGQRVRVHLREAEPARRVGVVTALSADSLVLAMGEGAGQGSEAPGAARAAFPVADIKRVEISTGVHRQTLEGLVQGGKVGLIAMLLGTVAGEWIAGDSESMAVFAGCAAAGGAVGAFVRKEDWRRLPLNSVRVSLGPAPGADIASGSVLSSGAEEIHVTAEGQVMALRVLSSIRRSLPVLSVVPALALSATLALGAEFGVGVGLAGVSLDASGYGGQVRFRMDDSHWYFGWEYGVGLPYTFYDPFTGRPLTEESEFATGPFVHYRFRARSRSSWYVGAAVLHWSRTETSLVFGDEATSSTTDPYFGGGFVSLLTRHLLFNGGLLVSPTAELAYATSTSSFEGGGNLDVELLLIFVF